MVLRRRADERGPADVDVLDHLGVLDTARGRGALERVEVHAHEIDRLDPVLVDRAHVLLARAHSQEPRVDLRVERLDPPVEDLREARVVVHRPRLDPGLGQLARRAAGRDDLDAELGEPAGEVDEPALVGHRQERPAHLHLAGLHHPGRLRVSLRHRAPVTWRPSTSTAPAAISLTTRGSSSCSISWTRVSTPSISRWYGSSNASCMMIGPESTPSSTKWTVTPVTLHPVVERLLYRADARERGQKRRMNVHDPAAKPCDQPGAEDLHEPGEHDELARRDPRASRQARRRAPRGRRSPPRGRRAVSTPASRGARQRLRVRLVRRHADDLDPVAAVDLVEQRLQVRAGPGCEDRYRKASRRDRQHRVRPARGGEPAVLRSARRSARGSAPAACATTPRTRAARRRSSSRSSACAPRG